MAAKKQHAFKAIEKAVLEARAKGILIYRTPMFDWTGLSDGDRSLPKGVDATGAVLLQMGYGRCEFTYNGKGDIYGTGEVRPKGWTVLVQKHLGVGVFWLWCFWNGWDNHRQIQVAEKDKNGDIIGWKDEGVSKEAIKMSKRLCSRY